MKRSLKLKQNFLPVFLAGFPISLLFGCKKDKEIKPQTFAEFDKLIETDPNLKLFGSSNAQVVLWTNLNKNALLNASKKLSDKEILDFRKTAKTTKEVELFLSSSLLGNTQQLLGIIHSETSAIVAFIKQYPEFNKLSIDDRRKIISKTIEKSLAELSYNSLIYLRNSEKLMLLTTKNFIISDACLYNYQQALSDCDFNFNLSVSMVIATAVIAVIATEGLGTAAAEATADVFIAGYIIDKYHCQNVAASNLDHCS